jgi:hypothetical protein
MAFSGVDLTRIDGISADTAQIVLTEIGGSVTSFSSEDQHFNPDTRSDSWVTVRLQKARMSSLRAWLFWVLMNGNHVQALPGMHRPED